jgi:hypothetical protein
MAVTISTHTLSSRVRYINVSPSTDASNDNKEILLAVTDALVDLGWTRFDTAGANNVIGSNSDSSVILRRQCDDFAQSGHYNYIGIRLFVSGSTFTVRLTQAADWSNPTSISAFVMPARGSGFTPNNTSSTFLNHIEGGTIWLFDSGKTLVLFSLSSTINTTNTGMYIISEYNKEFGENVDSTTQYIHNGVFTPVSYLFEGVGVDETTNSRSVMAVDRIEFQKLSSTGYYYMIGVAGSFAILHNSAHPNFTITHQFSGRTSTSSGGFPQFMLTEAPAADNATGTDNFSRNAKAPVTCGESFTTRLLMGYLGYVGHISPYCTTSLRFISGESQPSTNSVSSGTATSGPRAPMLFSSFAGTQSYLSTSMQEYAPNTLPDDLKFNIFEPTLCCGSTGAIPTTANASYFNGGTNSNTINTSTGTYTGPQFKFSLLGKMFDIKLFMTAPSNKYAFLDTITIPCDNKGFYSEGGTNKDFWIIPARSTRTFILMPK